MLEKEAENRSILVKEAALVHPRPRLRRGNEFTKCVKIPETSNGNTLNRSAGAAVTTTANLSFRLSTD